MVKIGWWLKVHSHPAWSPVPFRSWGAVLQPASYPTSMGYCPEGKFNLFAKKQGERGTLFRGWANLTCTSSMINTVTSLWGPQWPGGGDRTAAHPAPLHPLGRVAPMLTGKAVPGTGCQNRGVYPRLNPRPTRGAKANPALRGVSLFLGIWNYWLQNAGEISVLLCKIGSWYFCLHLLPGNILSECVCVCVCVCVCEVTSVMSDSLWPYGL